MTRPSVAPADRQRSRRWQVTAMLASMGPLAAAVLVQIAWRVWVQPTDPRMWTLLTGDPDPPGVIAACVPELAAAGVVLIAIVAVQLTSGSRLALGAAIAMAWGLQIAGISAMLYWLPPEIVYVLLGIVLVVSSSGVLLALTRNNELGRARHPRSLRRLVAYLSAEMGCFVVGLWFFGAGMITLPAGLPLLCILVAPAFRGYAP